MHCKDIQKNIAAWLDGESGVRLAGEIENHLAGCPECSRIVQESSSVRNLLRAVAPSPLPEGFADSVMRKVRLHAIKAPAKVSVVAWWRELTFPLQAAAAVSFLLIIYAGVFMGANLSHEDRQQSSGVSATSADAVVTSMMQPFGETGAETIADAYLALTITDDGGR
jgi:anti-sigma factor RsiW